MASRRDQETRGPAFGDIGGITAVLSLRRRLHRLERLVCGFVAAQCKEGSHER